MICIPDRVLLQIINSGRMRLVGHGICMGEKRNTYRVLVGNPE